MPVRHSVATRMLAVGFAALLVLITGPLPGTAIGGSPQGPDAASEAGEKKHAHTNRLIDSRNPYLLLHAHNPVDWYPWGQEAFDKAKRENKPIFLSVGYSTCFWCHVAERTIYSNPEIAALMNRWFINVKVDREQRPDVDRIYMLATQLLTRHGGWPSNGFLTPNLKPFYAGSYFPPEDDAFGRPGFVRVLQTMHDLWIGEPDQVFAAAESLYAAMQRVRQRQAGGTTVAIAPAAWMARARTTLLPQFDPDHGGLMSSAAGPKFPREPVLDLLLADHRVNGDSEGLDRLTATLDAMAYGGIWDHLGGGFYRYSTEPTWSVPHFEKVLYNNAQLLGIFAEAHRQTSRPLYRHVAEGLADYLSRQMMAPAGGFYTARDSQIDGDEGASYLWTEAEIEAVLGPADSQRFFRVYVLTPMPSNPIIDGTVGPSHDPKRGGLRIRLPIAETVRNAGSNDVVETVSALEPLRRKLLAIRDRRPQPARDEKMTLDLNGLVIGALAVSAVVLDRPEYMAWARRAAERLWALAYDPGTGDLEHEIFQGRAQTDGYRADYALLGRGFMAMYEATGEAIWRERAAMLADALLARFASADGGAGERACGTRSGDCAAG